MRGRPVGDADGDTKTVRETRPLDNTFTPSEEFERSVFGKFNHDAPQNVSAEPVERIEAGTVGQERRYLISPDTMFALLQRNAGQNKRCWGFTTRNPNHPARPSVYDREWASPWYAYIIVSVLDGVPDALTAWQLADDRAAFNPEVLEEI